MAKHSSRHVDHETCVAYFRDALSSQRAMQVRAYLETHPDEARRARIDADYDRAIAQQLAGTLKEPVPPRLRIETRSATSLWTGRLAFVATIVASAAIGWWFGGVPVDNPNAAFTERVVSAAQRPIPPTTTQAAAHTPNDVQPPDLSLQGYRLVQQQMASAGPALIEFVYRNARGQQLRIYAESSPKHDPVPTVTSRGGLTLVQWREGGTRYALVGDMPRLSLQTLAQAARAGSVGGEGTLAVADQLQAAQTDDRYRGVETREPSSIANEVAPVGMNNDYMTQPSRM